MSNNKLILGTGLSGLVGSSITKQLTNKYSFYNLDLTHGVDITKPASITKAVEENPGMVMLHLAGFTNVNAAQEQNGDQAGSCYQVNVEGTKNVAQVCASHDIPLIHISTGYVFDGLKAGPYQENDSVNPTDWYSITKNEAEKYLLSEHPKTTILRINFPYRQDKFPKQDIWHKMAATLQAGKNGPFFDDHYFSMTPLEWFSKIIDWMISHHPAGVFHAVTDTVYSDYSLAQTIQNNLGLNMNLQASSVHSYNKTASRPYQPSLILSNQKLKQVMGDQFPYEC